MLIHLLVVLFLIAVALWALGQFPLDPTIVKIIRVILIIVAILACLNAFGLIPGRYLVW